jgi:hypothetical protein
MGGQTHLVLEDQCLFYKPLKVIKMTDFMFFVFTEIFGADLEDAKDIPWGTQFFFYPPLGLLIGMIVLKFIGNENKEEEK